jgi:2,4-dienoyl-CoA reductase-like NADH-dependent reductase (Old Yellow Enzyme family)
MTVARVFERTRINNIELENRFVRSATWEGLATDDGVVTDRLIDISVQLAKGGVGLIITGHGYVLPEGQASLRQLAIYDDRFIAGLAAMVDAVHAAGGKIVMQISHAGCRADLGLTGMEAIGPSSMGGEAGLTCREMTNEDIAHVTRAFALAASRAAHAGFDGVQVHAAHAYLLSQFLSPFHNKRKDAYGGSVENRARMMLEVVHAVREAIGVDRALLVKMNSEDFVDGGFSVQEMLEASSLLEGAGVDAIELSGGSPFSRTYVSFRPGPIRTQADEAYYREAAVRYKEKVRVPLMLVGGIRSFGLAERLVKDSVADYISLSRPLIREPGLINRWRSGDRRKAACVSDNGCFKPARTGLGLSCVVEERAGKKSYTLHVAS